MKNYIFTIFFLSASLLVNAQYDVGGINLSYFKNCTVSEAVTAANVEKKQVLVYLHKTKCDACVRFADKIFLDSSVKHYLVSRFTCVGADLTTKEGNGLAVETEVFKSPALVVMTRERRLKFSLNLTLDPEAIINQMNNWFKLVSILDQIESYASTNHIKPLEAAKAIGGSYAKTEFAKDPDAVIEPIIFSYTLDRKEVKGFKEGFIERWNELQSKRKKK